ARRDGDLERSARTGEMHGEARRPDRLQIGGTRRSGVEGLEPPGRAGEERRRVAASQVTERDLRLEQLTVGVLQLIQRSMARSLQELGSRLRSAGSVSGARRRERTPSAPLGIRG